MVLFLPKNAIFFKKMLTVNKLKAPPKKRVKSPF